MESPIIDEIVLIPDEEEVVAGAESPTDPATDPEVLREVVVLHEGIPGKVRGKGKDETEHGEVDIKFPVRHINFTEVIGWKECHIAIGTKG